MTDRELFDMERTIDDLKVRVEALEIRVLKPVGLDSIKPVKFGSFLKLNELENLAKEMTKNGK